MSNKYERLKQLFEHKEAFIIGSGPSLAYKRMDFLNKYPTLSVNLGFLMFQHWGMNPVANMFSDKDVLLNNLDLYKQFLFNNHNIIKILTGRAAQEATADIIDESTLVLPKIRPVGEIGFEPSPSQNGFFRGNTVIYNGVQLINELGSSGVNIVGMDLSVDVDWGKNGHAFEIQQLKQISVDFGLRYQSAIRKGLPNNPHQRENIESSFKSAYEYYNSVGKFIRTDLTSSLRALPKMDLLNRDVKQPSVVAVVPAKSKSERLPHKNIRKLGGKPLYLHQIDNLLQCYTVDKVVLDTDSIEIANLLEDRDVYWMKRPTFLASNDVDGHQLFTYEASQLDCDILLQVLPTSPLLRSSTLDDLVYEVIKDDQYDSAFAVNKKSFYLWDNQKPINYNIESIPNSKDLKPLTIECMSAYAVERDIALKSKRRVGYKPSLFEIPPLESIDIDDQDDFMIAEALLKMRDEHEP